MKSRVIQPPLGLCAIDIDGTLVTDEGHITERVFTSLKAAKDADWEVVIASGRTYSAASPVLEELPFVKYAVLCNGSCIIDAPRREIVALHTLPKPLVREIVGVARETGVLPALYSADMFNQKVYYDSLEDAPEYFTWYMDSDPRCAMIPDVLGVDEPLVQFGSIARRDFIFNLKDRLEGLPLKIVTVPFESAHIGGKDQEYWFIQIVHAEATKHNALEYIRRMLGIGDGCVVAVGDNYNDREMIEGAGVGVAMGNAPDEIKSIARLVVGHNNGSGLAEAVEKVILSADYFPELHRNGGGGN